MTFFASLSELGEKLDSVKIKPYDICIKAESITFFEVDTIHESPRIMFSLRVHANLNYDVCCVVSEKILSLQLLYNLLKFLRDKYKTSLRHSVDEAVLIGEAIDILRNLRFSENTKIFLLCRATFFGER